MSVSPRLRALLQALLVTFLWSTSWVLIKYALVEIPPLTFAGLRYTLAFLFLLPALWQHRRVIRATTPQQRRRLALLGLIYYALTQGAQFFALQYLEAITLSMVLNFASVLVALFGIFALREIPAPLQWIGLFTFIVGVLIHFFPLSLSGDRALGFVLAGITGCANAAASLLGRAVNRDRVLPPVVVTATSMGVGAVLLLGIGWATQGLPRISPTGWLIVVWLAAVNTALAFTLWNNSLRRLSAVESSTINNTMLIQIALLAWLFLGESLTLREGIGLALTAGGIFVAQWRPSRDAREQGAAANPGNDSPDASLSPAPTS